MSGITGTYGLGTSIRGPAGAGPGLAGLGQQQQQLATQLLGQAADSEAERAMRNKQIKAQEEAGKTQLGAGVGALGGYALGATYGAKLGSAAGPWGALIGGVVGALAGSAF